jgi:PDZ domain-containing protein
MPDVPASKAGTAAVDWKLTRLASHPLLAYCSSADIRRIAGACEAIELEPGQRVTHQGWMADWLILIHRGVLEILQDDQVVDVVWSGHQYGELEVLAGGLYEATVRAATRTEVCVVNRRYIPALLDTTPGLKRALRDRLEIRDDDGARNILEAWAQHAVRRRMRRVRRVAAVLGALSVLTAAAVIYHPPVALMSPGPAIDLSRDIEVEGVPTYPLEGRYLMITVRYSRPNLLRLAWEVNRRGRRVLSLVGRRDQGDAAIRARAQFQRSRLTAAAAAAGALGMNVALDGTGARVTEVDYGSPGAFVLQPGDVIVAVNGEPVALASEATDAIGRASGAPAALTVERHGQRLALELEAVADADEPEAARTGIRVETRDPSFRLPFRIRFTEHDVVGPSAGLAYALVIYDLLSAGDPVGGGVVAATGTIDAEGRLSVVGGVSEKAAAAQRKRAGILLVPWGETSEAEGHGARVVGVRSLREALAALRTSEMER